ncbi:uncharacterized protein isoform X2 [Choristoneura fumiferana]|uniref:uncharacterized protein isoform X2 n=1 Tax=Choristoneura fumiferana TaxID=7141 RepID=UPI003D15BD95
MLLNKYFSSIEPVEAEKKQEDLANGDNMEDLIDDDAMVVGLNNSLDPDTSLELENLRLEHLKLQEAQVLCKHRMLLLKQAEKKSSSTSRCILPNGRIVVRNVEKSEAGRDGDASFGTGAGDSNARDTVCSCKGKIKCSWDGSSDDDSSTASTCVLYSEDKSRKTGTIDRRNSDKSCSKYTDSKKSEGSKTEFSSKIAESKTTYSETAGKVTERTKKSDYSKTSTSQRIGKHKSKLGSDMSMKYSDFYSDSEDEADETNRLIQLRNSDYLDIVEDPLKIVIALAGYPKSKMRLRQMELFQRCLAEVMDMQFKAGLMKKTPTFLDYYLNRGAIVCICKDIDTRNWMVRISPGLQERMCTNLILLKSKVKRLCLAILKIPSTCWPATAQDAFKLLQYFNPTLKTELWKVYAEKKVNGVECTSFLIDRVSGEIIRGPTFKNIIDYDQMEFELYGYTEIYYECLVSDMEEDLRSVSSRVKLLQELRSQGDTPRNISDCSLQKQTSIPEEKEEKTQEFSQEDNITEKELATELEHNLQSDVLMKLKDVKYISEKDEVIVWPTETSNYGATSDKIDQTNVQEFGTEDPLTATDSAVPGSEKTESIMESNENLISRSSNLNIDSNRGIAYHRRTNYLHVEHELKIAITLEGYPQNKLEGTHIRRLKHLFKEYLHKDMKQQRFANLIIPKFQDIYLSNGAVIYICDSLETKDYLTEVLPKFINSTGWKLTFRDIKSLVRYTRIVMRLPKDHANVESVEILTKLQLKYPGLKPDCWKYYSDVAGKQKRQFGVDPESLEVIKRPDFDPSYEGEKLSFRIIDRQKRDVSFDENNQDDNDEDNDNKKLKDKVLKLFYVPIEADMTNYPLTRIRTNHYSDMVADDLKLYVGPNNYPESRIDENLFHSIKKTLEYIVYKAFENGEVNENTIPKLHDMYLFDGVIFVICQDMNTRHWIDEVLPLASAKLQINLKSTEFRGAVGIISMVIKTCLDTDEVISILQSNNPRLRTKYWRTISKVRTKTKLDVVLQIDKLSAQVIRSPNFNQFVGANPVQFKLGHLQSLIQHQTSIEEEAVKKQSKKSKKSSDKPKVVMQESKYSISIFEELKSELKRDYPELKINEWDVLETHNVPHKLERMNDKSIITEKETKSADDKVSELTSDQDPVIIEADTEYLNTNPKLSPTVQDETCKMVVKIPSQILPENKEDLNLIFDLLEDQNPGLNTELWYITNDFGNHEKGKFIISIDKQSASVIRSKNFSPVVAGQRLKFLL